jgi:hypothetical protein
MFSAEQKIPIYPAINEVIFAVTARALTAPSH